MNARFVFLIAASIAPLAGCGVLPVHPAFCPGTYYYGPRPIVAPFLPQPVPYNQYGAALPPAMPLAGARPHVAQPYAPSVAHSGVIQASHTGPRLAHRAHHAQHVAAVNARIAARECQCRVCRERRLRARHLAPMSASPHDYSDRYVTDGYAGDCCSGCDSCTGQTYPSSAMLPYETPSMSYGDFDMSGSAISSDCPCQSGGSSHMYPAGELQMAPPAMEFEYNAEEGVPMPSPEPQRRNETPQPMPNEEMPPVTHLRIPQQSGSIQMTSFEQTESLVIPAETRTHSAMKDSTTPTVQSRITIPPTRVISRRME